MSPDKIVVSVEDIDLVVAEPGTAPIAPVLYKKPPPAIPLWTRIVLSFLVLVLPLLCLVAIFLRIAFRSQPPRTRYALLSLISTLLIVSSFLTMGATAIVLSLVPVPAIVNSGLPDLDERTEFPVLNPQTTLSSSEASSKLKPLVVVVSPAAKLWSHQEVASQYLGAGMLLQADNEGYLFATANHVASHTVGKVGSPPHVMVTTEEGIWSTADVVATSEALDIALLWVPRHSGKGQFVQPIAVPHDGEEIFVIGHPEGLKYTLSSGIISGLRNDSLQISAAISPGNSGGPVYDVNGELLGVVSSKFDNNRDANAENLGFATSAETLHNATQWTFYGKGRERLQSYLKGVEQQTQATPESKKQP